VIQSEIHDFKPRSEVDPEIYLHPTSRRSRQTGAVKHLQHFNFWYSGFDILNQSDQRVKEEAFINSKTYFSTNSKCFGSRRLNLTPTDDFFFLHLSRISESVLFRVKGHVAFPLCPPVCSCNHASPRPPSESITVYLLFCTQAGVLGFKLLHELQHAVGPDRPPVVQRRAHAG